MSRASREGASRQPSKTVDESKIHVGGITYKFSNNKASITNRAASLRTPNRCIDRVLHIFVRDKRHICQLWGVCGCNRDCSKTGWYYIPLERAGLGEDLRGRQRSVLALIPISTPHLHCRFEYCRHRDSHREDHDGTQVLSWANSSKKSPHRSIVVIGVLMVRIRTWGTQVLSRPSWSKKSLHRLWFWRWKEGTLWRNIHCEFSTQSKPTHW